MQTDVMYNIKMYTMRIISWINVFCKTIVRFALQMTTPTMPYVVRDVKCISTEHDRIKDVSHDYFNRRLPVCKDDEYIEYTVLFNDKIYKLISTNKHPIEPCLSLFHKKPAMSTNHRIICAYLCAKDDTRSDMLTKLFQYAGPKHDFFGQECKIHWLFRHMTEDDRLDIMYSDGTRITYRMKDHV